MEEVLSSFFFILEVNGCTGTNASHTYLIKMHKLKIRVKLLQTIKKSQ